MNRRHLILSGRILISIIFLLSGIGKIFDWAGNAQQMADKAIPLVPLLLTAALIIELAGALSLLSGLYVRWGASLLFFYLIPTTLLMHNFWAYSGLEQQMQLVHFLKNLAIMGGLVLATAEPTEAVMVMREEEEIDEFEEEQPRMRAAGGMR